MKQTQRTKNRLAEHPDLAPVRRGRFLGPGVLAGRPCVLASGSRWRGWLPMDELPEGHPLRA